MVDTSQVAEESYAAAAAEAEDRGFGTSQEDINAYAEAAGAVAAAAACTAVGAGAAAPVCAYLGGELAGWLSDTIGGWFSNEDEIEAEQHRRDQLRAHFAQYRWASELNQNLGNLFMSAVEDVTALHEELWPGERWEGLDPSHPQYQWQPAMLLLQLNGAPLESRDRDGVITLGLESVAQLWWDLDQHGVYDANKQTRVSERAEQIAAALTRAYDASVLQLTTQKAAERAMAAVAEAQSRPEIRQVGGRPQIRTIQATSAETAHEVHARTRPGPYIAPRDRSWAKSAAISGGALGAGAALTLLLRAVVP